MKSFDIRRLIQKGSGFLGAISCKSLYVDLGLWFNIIDVAHSVISSLCTAAPYLKKNRNPIFFEVRGGCTQAR